MAAYLVAVLLVGGSITVGYAVTAASGSCSAASPAVGVAVVVVLATSAVRLPGAATTSAVVVVLTLVAALVWLGRTRRLRLPTLGGLSRVAWPPRSGRCRSSQREPSGSRGSL